ncbi:hypothetical protein ACWDYH_10820 [Nocardia goodfellowii]|uniref:Uncharacterized protein n=1 Tax=Nocardia goodfellowii TaxID=882446 RepID=A0ABS4QEM2_9NOCA|nr:hypothetical protein [Nocardia goodfellowii]MBP2190122.1 hypothetical protein [Nocardia goodfellowii]
MKRYTTLLATAGLLAGGTIAVQLLGGGEDGGRLPLILEAPNSRVEMSHSDQADNPLPDAWGLLYR